MPPKSNESQSSRIQTMKEIADGSEDNHKKKEEEALRRRKDSRKLFTNSKGQQILRRSFVTYMDELGTSARLKAYDNQKLTEDLKLYDRMRNYLHDEVMGDGDLQKALYFSDNVVVVEPIDSRAVDEPASEDYSATDNTCDPGGFYVSLSAIAGYQLNLARIGRFLRGGIVVDDAYADDNFVTGPAHLQAVVLEETEAIAPRILLDDSAVEQLKAEIEAGGNEVYELYEELLLADHDGKVFVNYLPIIFHEGGFTHAMNPIEGLINHRDQVSDMLTSSVPLNIFYKYVWVADYHDYVVANCPLLDEELNTLDTCQKYPGLEKKDLLIGGKSTTAFKPFNPCGQSVQK